MKKSIVLVFAIINISLAFCHENTWQTYELENLLEIDLPGDVYEMDTAFDENDIYQFYSIIDSTTFLVQKALAEKEYVDENLSTLPHDSISLTKFYQGAIKTMISNAPGKLKSQNIAYRNNYWGYKLEFADSLGNNVFVTEFYLLNQHLIFLTIVDLTGIDFVDEEYFFNSLQLFQTDAITQYYGQSRDYRIGYLLGKGLAFLAIVGVIVWLIIKKLRK
jgi:hypothetical protein